MNDEIAMRLARAEGQVVAALVRYDGDDARRIAHAMKVWGYATAIAELEGLGLAERETLRYAAILHDIGIHNAERIHGSSAGNFQELEGPPVARELLEPVGLPEAVLERVLFLIGNHHSYGKVDGADFRILVEADFVVNAQEDALPFAAIQAARQAIFKTSGGRAVLEQLFGA
jgi:HD superfamily phosphodiesterase